jgi:hypothetical protein
LASAPELGLAAAKKRGVKLGGLNAKGIAERQALRERAEQLRPLNGLGGLVRVKPPNRTIYQGVVVPEESPNEERNGTPGEKPRPERLLPNRFVLPTGAGEKDARFMESLNCG